jgi:hypothetical protein
MKALLISAILFFSLRAMSEEVGENQKAPCPYANQTASREAKITIDTTAVASEEQSTTSKK